MPPLPKLPTLLALLACALVPPARAQSPDLTAATPLAARPGSETTITWQGANLLGPLSLWTSFGATNSWEAPAPGKDGKPVAPDGKKLVGKLRVPAAAPLGVGFVRVATENGLSGPFFFLVDDLPLLERTRGNDSPGKAQLLKLPVAVEGNTEAGKADYFQIELQAGESVSVEVFAARLLSKCDPMLRLLDARGNELAFADDTPGFVGDCWLRYRATQAGPVILEVRDASWLGGAAHRYHVRVGDFPLATVAFPPAAAPGATFEARALGGGNDALNFKTVVSKIPGEVVPVPIRFAAGKPAALVLARAEALPIQLEQEPNDTPAQALTVRAPVAIYGTIGTPGDRDVFRLAVKKDERFTLTPLTRSLGSPALLYLAVEDEKGALLAANDTANTQPSLETPLMFRATADGHCRIFIGELTRRGGPEFTYGLRVEAADRGFELALAGDRFAAALGGSFTVKVTAQRRNVSGPITLALVSGDERALPAGFAVEDNVIEKGKNETSLKITAPADVPAGAIYNLAVIGRGLEGTNEVTARARPPAPNPANAKDPSLALLALPSIPRLLRETIAVGVGVKVADFFTISVPAGPVGLARVLGKGSFVVSQKPVAKDFTSLVKLSFEGLPKGVTVTVQTPKLTKTGVADFRCDLAGPTEALTGEKNFTIIATGEHKGVTKEVRLTNVVLRAIEPLAVAAKAAGGLKAGGKQKLQVSVKRLGEAADAAVVEVRITKWPRGITGPEAVTIAANQTSAELELTADAALAPGKLEGLVLTAITKLKAQDVKVESAPVVLEVVK